MTADDHPLSENEIFSLGRRLERHSRAAEAAAENADPIARAFIRSGLHALDLLAVNDAYGDLGIVLDHTGDALRTTEAKLVGDPVQNHPEETR